MENFTFYVDLLTITYDIASSNLSLLSDLFNILVKNIINFDIFIGCGAFK